ncbi:MAG: biopolymer transporter ExbD [Spirochaetaceae bacterium]|jgi:biopolymer transport protein ExbD|nr:biopolymer transporter ExbD [Spirochaetaceae bacterium]
MKIRRPKRSGAGESAAFSDLAFLLIIYFLVIAGFTVNKGFLLGLQAKDQALPVRQDDMLRFRLDREGRLFLDGDVMDFREAGSIIARAASPGFVLVLEADPLVPWQEVVSFVELARNLEVETFSFATGEALP